jgi:hypothetical protein
VIIATVRCNSVTEYEDYIILDFAPYVLNAPTGRPIWLRVAKQNGEYKKFEAGKDYKMTVE